MTVQKAFTLFCDFPTGTYGPTGETLRCGRAITIDYKTGPVDSVKDARTWAQEQGWSRTLGQDRCPQHPG